VINKIPILWILYLKHKNHVGRGALTPTKVTTSGRAGGLRYEPLKADCFKPPKGRQSRIELTDRYVDLLLLDV
jgi:hypothetical protein